MKAKKIFYGIIGVIVLILYIIIYKTNIVAEPVFNNKRDENIVVQGKKVRYDISPIFDEEKIFLDYRIVKNELKMDLLWDEKNSIMIYCDESRVIRINMKSNTIRINRDEKVENDSLKMFQGIPVISSDFIEKNSNFVVRYSSLSKNITIDELSKVPTAQIINGCRLREKKSIWSTVIDKMSEKETIYIYETSDDWAYIRDERGFYGYIKTKDYLIVSDEKNNREEYENEEEQGENINLKPISMTWDYVRRKANNVAPMKKIDGLDILCPTWFAISNENGNITDKGSLSYSKQAHKAGYKVWALISNSFNRDLTSKVLNNTVVREKLINQLMDKAKKYDFDGINLDFENVYLKDKDMLTQFVKELYPLCKENEIVLSIDVTVKSGSENWSMFYDRKKLGKVVDYMILMAYDEHWKACPVSGSVASLPWVEKGLNNLITMVDREKVVLGAPLYTRLWKEVVTDMKVKTSASDLSMKTMQKVLDERDDVKYTFDEESKQDYGEYTKNGVKYRVWIENKKSMKERIDLVKKYKIGGLATWRKGFEKEEIWELISNELYK